MSTKHTPGPWEAIGNLVQIAECRDAYFDPHSDEAKANARLIAAAPELLEALQSIAEYWNRDQNETAMADACWHAIETAMAAITKATGDQQ